jgi:hypothetical protein
MDERAKRDAEWLAQLAIESVEVAGREARVSGKVIRVFRGKPELLGTSQTLTLPIYRGDGSDSVKPGDLSPTPLEQLRPGRVLEAYLDDTEHGPQITLDLSTVLDAPTDEAQLPVFLAPAPPQPKRSITPILLVLAAMLIAALFVLLR